jgi:phosphatidylglycerophosphatase A
LRATGATPWIEAGAAGALLLIGAWSATVVEQRLGTTDPGPVVIDEVMGMIVTLIGAPVSWSVTLAGFLLFRAFDIVKPPPARSLERAHGGWGIMLDDLAAGAYAWGVLQALLWIAPGWVA